VIVTKPENLHRDLVVLAAEKGAISLVRKMIETRHGGEVIAYVLT